MVESEDIHPVEVPLDFTPVTRDNLVASHGETESSMSDVTMPHTLDRLRPITHTTRVGMSYVLIEPNTLEEKPLVGFRL